MVRKERIRDARSQLRERVREVGYCLIEGVIPAGEVAAVRDSVLAVVPDQRNPDAPANVGAVSGLINYTQAFAPFLTEPRLLGLCKALLGEQVRVSFTSTIVNYPGNERGKWHADWPFYQMNAGHIPAPYADALIHLTTIWMLTPFAAENGATLIVPGSHRESNNPTGDNGVEMFAPLAGEVSVEGEAGSVMVMDSRMWHATTENAADGPRVGLAIRFAPWWLNLDVLMPGTDERRRMVEETGLKENRVPAVEPGVFEALPEDVKPLFRHWLRRN